MDAQRQRLKRMVANAILDLWKKETGSLSSVVIEGTICITSGNGATIVIQVCDEFVGVIPDTHGSCMKRPNSTSELCANDEDGEKRMNQSVIRPNTSIDLTTSYNNSALSSHYLADISSNTSHVSHVGPERKVESRCWSSSSDQVFYSSKMAECDGRAIESDSDSDELVVDNQEENEIMNQPPGRSTSSYTMADDLSSSGYSSMLGKSMSSTLERSQTTTLSRSISPDTSRVNHDRPDRSLLTPLRRRSASPAMMHSPSTSTPIDGSKRARMQDMDNHQKMENVRTIHSEGDARDDDGYTGRVREHSMPAQSSSALDLSSSQRDHELSLSSPQNYTEQVRDVIRSRILATKNGEAASIADAEARTSAVTSPQDFTGGSSSVGASTSVTVDTSDSHSYLNHSAGHSTTNNINLPDMKIPMFPITSVPDSRDPKSMMPDIKVPMFHNSGPASWPAANQDKPCHMPPPPVLFSNGKLLMPNNLSLLSVGLPNGAPMMPGSLSPSLFPGFFPPGFVPRSIPLSLGLNVGSLPNISKPPLVSPKTPSSQGSTTPSISLQENEDGRYWEYVSGRSTPEVMDINGNSEKHLGANGEQKVYVCEYCNKQFLFKSKYHEHLPVHTNARPYQCHLCSRTYKYKYDLQVHLRTHMGIPTKSTICPFCMQKFETNKMLRNHIVEMHRDRQKVTKEECTQPLDNLPPAL